MVIYDRNKEVCHAFLCILRELNVRCELFVTYKWQLPHVKWIFSHVNYKLTSTIVQFSYVD